MMGPTSIQGTPPLRGQFSLVRGCPLNVGPTIHILITSPHKRVLEVGEVRKK